MKTVLTTVFDAVESMSMPERWDGFRDGSSTADVRSLTFPLLSRGSHVVLPLKTRSSMRY